MRDKHKNYKKFNLKKKNGTLRTIYSPRANLAILQKKLAYVLSLNFKPHKRSHGFVQDRSIVTNAAQHINKKFVLNFDLDNFFDSIKFRRVRHMFLAYFKFNDNIATILANICCHPNGFLPQGAATSPIVSNILAKSLDKDLTKIALNTKGSQYTRYADDITFSTNKKNFPKEIAFLDNDGNVKLGERIISIVEKWGFKINHNKTRLHNSRQNQTVTGVVVNEKLNINRKYIRRIRSILNCIEKNINNIDRADEIFVSKYPFRQRKKSEKPNMFLVVKGMISHVGHVKGKHDQVYIKLARRFTSIAQKHSIQPIGLPLTLRQFHEINTFIIDNPSTEYYIEDDDNLGEFIYGQGSGFLLKGVGLVTNAHVIREDIDVLEFKLKFAKEYYIAFYKPTDHDIQLWAKIDCYDIEKDIAILSVKEIDLSKGYDYNESIEEEDPITLIGYPDYKKGQEIRIEKGFVKGVRILKIRFCET
ncbi:reverse transcriptase domain-containing protein [Bacillus sp. SCS-151]|uniref:reverse transcriptase domain-containing protein n=1 Tax=Nanhaiella sioensis TaxID=3115293 RepID=UPI00397D219E